MLFIELIQTYGKMSVSDTLERYKHTPNSEFQVFFVK